MNNNHGLYHGLRPWKAGTPSSMSFEKACTACKRSCVSRLSNDD